MALEWSGFEGCERDEWQRRKTAEVVELVAKGGGGEGRW